MKESQVDQKCLFILNILLYRQQMINVEVLRKLMIKTCLKLLYIDFSDTTICLFDYHYLFYRKNLSFFLWNLVYCIVFTLKEEVMKDIYIYIYLS